MTEINEHKKEIVYCKALNNATIDLITTNVIDGRLINNERARNLIRTAANIFIYEIMTEIKLGRYNGEINKVGVDEFFSSLLRKNQNMLAGYVRILSKRINNR